MLVFMPRAKKPKPPVESPRLPKSFSTERLELGKSAPPQITGLGHWKVDTIVAARSAQVAGNFRQPVALAKSLLTDPMIYAGMLNRIAPHRGLPKEINSPTELTGTPLAILEEARANFCTETCVGLAPSVIADDFERIAMHGISVDQVRWVPRCDGSREDAFVEHWPLESVDWDPSAKKLWARTTEGRVEIVHGDGRWIVLRHHADQPWRWGALVPLAMLWPDNAYGRRDAANSATSHGDDKWIGTLPEGVSVEEPIALAMLNEMEKLYNARRVMITPFGSSVKRDEAMSQAWQIFKEQLDRGGKDVQRILLGQDGTMSNTGGNYVKSWGLFGVRNDIIERDLSTAGSGYSTGLLRPWSIINFGRWDRLEYEWLIPDADEDARRASIAERRSAFWQDLASAKSAGCVVDQKYVDTIAAEYGIKAPKLAAVPPSDESAAPTSITAHREPLRPAA